MGIRDRLPSAAGAVNLGGEALALTAGASFTCALLQTGAARCWGANTYGQLGYGDTTPVGVTNTPDDAGDRPVSTSITAIEAGDESLCAVINNGALRCWGRNESGQLGYGGVDHVGDDESVTMSR